MKDDLRLVVAAALSAVAAATLIEPPDGPLAVALAFVAIVGTCAVLVGLVAKART